jgi:DnaJ-class molecular chaperone
MRADEWFVKVVRNCDKCNGKGEVENQVFRQLMQSSADYIKIYHKPPPNDWWDGELATYGIVKKDEFPPEMNVCKKCNGEGKVEQLIRVDEFIAHFIRGGTA